MQVKKVLPLSKLNTKMQKKATKKNESKLSFAEILNTIQQSELSSKIASSSKLAKSPASISTDKVSFNTKLNGDYISSLAIINPKEADKNAIPQGNAAGSLQAKGKKIDKTSKLYEQSLELESYFVKIMLDSMKKTLSGSALGSESYASKMYRDIVFDELSRVVTKNAGFGLADQIYLQLV